MPEFVLFALVGAISTAVHYAVLVMLASGASVEPVAASCLGFAAGALVNYLLNYHATFRAADRHLGALSRFLLIAITGAAINSAIVAAGVYAFDLHYLLAQVSATLAVLSWSYGMNKHWTFRSRRP